MKTEKELADELGLDRKIIAGWRKDGYFSSSGKAGNQIIYEPTEEHELRNFIQKKILAESLGDPVEPKEPQEKTITKIPLNPKLVMCGTERIRVRENKNFLPGMKLTARPPATGEQVWVMVGRCPRWRGKY